MHPRGCTRAALEQGANHVPGGGLVPGGTCYSCRCGARGGLPFWSPAAPAFSLFVCPHPPDPLPGGKGGILLYFTGGSAPGTPGIKPLAALTEPAKQVPGATESLRFNAKPTERFPYKQCRQPRRGGTGGEELRRLRWSSPPGQGEQVPAGASQPQTPRGRDSKCRRDIRSPHPQKTNHQTFIDVSCAAHRRAV